MHYIILALAAIAATSSAHVVNLEKRKVFTITKYVDVWTTVTVYGSTPSVAAVDGNARNGVALGGSGRKKSSSIVASAVPSIAPVASAPAASIAPIASAAPKVSSVQVQQPAQSSIKVVQQAPASSAAAPVASSAPVSPPAGGSYQDAVLYHHNVHRANHSAPALAWSQSLADTAMRIAQTCQYGHNTTADGGGYGQNIAAGKPVSQISYVVSEQFYNGEVGFFTGYGQPTPNDFDANFKKYGHFTAVVWVGTTTVGCASYDCSKTGLGNVANNVPPIFHVCNYGPSGNVIGRFDKNVLPSQNQATVHG